jgi:hypothetical protein
MWLRTELRGWLQDVLLDRETTARGYFNRNSIEDLIAENSRSGKYSKELLSLVVLELWHRSFLSGNPVKVPATNQDPALALGD